MAGKPLERVVEQAVVKKAKTLGVMQLKLNVMGQRGWPDRLFLVPGGRPLFVEFKRPGGKPRPLQTYIHEAMEKAGYHVEVVDDSTVGVRLLREALEAAPVPEESREVSAGAPVCRTVPGPGLGKDVNHARRSKGAKEQGHDETGARDRAAARCTRGVAC